MSLQKVISKVGNTLALGVLPLAVAATVPQEAKAAKLMPENIDSLYVFGDSLSDTGNVFAATNGAFPPAPPYFQGRFSNGLNWIDNLSTDLLGLAPTPAFQIAPGQATPTAGINFAVGGSTTGFDNTAIPQLGGLQQQVGLFNTLITNNQITPTQAANPNALYVLWAGANDYLPTETTTFTPYKNTTITLDNLSTAAQSLANAGAKNIMVVDLPDLGKLPLTRELMQANELSNLTAQHNSQLFQTIQDQVGDSVNIIPFKASSFFNQAIANPSQFNFTNVTERCFNRNASPPSICPNPNEYFFWDEVHPTTATHGFVAEAAFNSLQAEAVPEPSSQLGILVFGVLGGAVMKRKVKKSRSFKISA